MSALPPIPAVAAGDIDGVVSRIENIVLWASDAAAPNRLGYFAALYLRITRGIRKAVVDGRFVDGERMKRFDVTFASRYFEALNGYFHPGDFPAPSLSWKLAFDAAALDAPIVVQHMLLGVNAHIDLDLGIAAWDVMRPGPLDPLQRDFDMVNTVLGEQVKTVLSEIGEISPVLKDLYDLFEQDEITLIDDALIWFRDSAWEFATKLAEAGWLDPALITLRDYAIAQFGSLMLHPPPVFAGLVTAIAAKESRDVARNIAILNAIAVEAL